MAAIGAFLAFLLLSASAFAADGSKNLLAAYHALEWEGAALEYNPDHGTLSFREENGGQTARIAFPAEDARGFWFYADLGNFENAGAGKLLVELLDENENVLERYETEKTAGDGSFHRYRLGSEEAYARLPEHTASVRVTLVFESGKSPYFRNLALYLDNMKTIETSAPEWNVSGKLQLVQVGVTKAQYWSWVVIIAAVPILMYITKKQIDRAKKIK